MVETACMWEERLRACEVGEFNLQTHGCSTADMGAHTATSTCKEHMGQNSLGHTDELSPQLADSFRLDSSSETSFDLVLSNTEL